METYLITEDELGAAELRAFTYDMALSTSGEYVLLPYLLRSAHHRKCFHFTQNPVVSVTNKMQKTPERRDVTGQKPFVTYMPHGQLYLFSFTSLRRHRHECPLTETWPFSFDCEIRRNKSATAYRRRQHRGPGGWSRQFGRLRGVLCETRS